jgi:predicted nicotinamide N-methyase
MTRTYLQLLWRIHQIYQTTISCISIDDKELQFVRIADPERVLQQVADEEDRRERLTGRRSSDDELHLPYWAEFWDSGAGIAQHLAANRQRMPMQHASVLDLGCGMGFAGAFAARLGARVLLADLEPAALLFARLNSLRDAARVRTRRLNWQIDRLDERFDLILGADILYETRQWEFLEPFWQAHLNGGGSVLLGEPGRQTGEAFVPWIQSRGWSLQQHEQRVATRQRPIRLFEICPQRRLARPADAAAPAAP